MKITVAEAIRELRGVVKRLDLQDGEAALPTVLAELDRLRTHQLDRSLVASGIDVALDVARKDGTNTEVIDAFIDEYQNAWLEIRSEQVDRNNASAD